MTTHRPATGAEGRSTNNSEAISPTSSSPAEALPAVLDNAAAEPSIIATLKRCCRSRSPPPSVPPRRRLRFASLPTPASLDDFDYDAQPAVDRHLIPEFATCRYLKTPPTRCTTGTVRHSSKSHFAVALARRAAEVGYRTYFTTAATSQPAATASPSTEYIKCLLQPPALRVSPPRLPHAPAEAASPCSRSCPSATSNLDRDHHQPRSRTRATSSATPPSPPPCSTGSCTAPSS